MPNYLAITRRAAIFMLTIACIVLPAQAEARRDSTDRSQQMQNSNPSITASEAATKARAQYGGKVLKVTRAGNAYKVRLLQDSGRVITVTIRG